MITLQDCLELCDLSEDEILAVAEHEHIPEIVAVELAQYLIEQPDGTRTLKRMIVDELDSARIHKDQDRIDQLTSVLHHFIATHPEFTPNRKESA